ncbi:MAG: Mrp/NBP35 family ATP-binding protein [Saprospiraceae bacterium]|nr:Mrp/NBP35 family ATP-binding protein [Saprospiraceae bacterium]MCB9323459.1 Mrp/NBP35 family ATP-binding protein [Lewinellaceae bacterium]
MSIETSVIIKTLAKVIDPGSGQDLITMSMVRDLAIEGKKVSFVVEVRKLDNDKKQQLNFACIEAIQQVYPDADVHVHMAGQGQQAPPQPGMQQNFGPPNPLPQVKNVIAIASGKGGVGKSTVAVNLALALKATGAKVGLIDADLYGPSIPTMMGLKGERPKIQDVYGSPKIIPLEAYGIPVISIGFIVEPEQAVVLRGPRLAGILGQFINDCIWPELDYLMIDLPPGTGDIQLTLVQSVPVTGAIMVTTPQEVAVADAIKALNMFLNPTINVPILGVVENMSWFTPEELPNNQYKIFGEGGGQKLAEFGKTKLLGQVPIVMGVRTGGDNGKPVVMENNNPAAEAFKLIAQNVVDQVAWRNKTQDPTEMVKITTQ